ncbi:DNA-3-methyladenine glycosylase [Chitinimonas naiadis]
MDHPYETASRFLAGIDADWAGLIAEVGPCRHATQPGREPYEALMRAVAHQQLHGKAAEAILARMVALYAGQDFPTPAQLLATDTATLRACGFSARKVDTLRGIADAAESGLVPSREQARDIDDEALITRLTSLPGIGRWTVEIMLIYNLERQDILPVDDFGVREGYRHLKSLPAQTTPRALARIGEAWAPYRTVAAWYLWRVPELPTYRKAVKPAV